MANAVFKTKQITLTDETDVLLRPLEIGRLRRFMEAWGKIADIGEDDDGFDVFINCSGIALEKNFKGQFDSLRATAEEYKEGEYLSPKYKEYLLETLDLDSIYEILDVSAGIKLNDPKLQEAAQEAARAQSGRTSI